MQTLIAKFRRSTRLALATALGFMAGNFGIALAATTFSTTSVTTDALNVGSTNVFSVSTGGVATMPVGSATGPSLAVVGDTNTGIFSSGADTLNLATGGTERLRVDSSGNVGIGATSLSLLLTVGSTNTFEVNSSGNLKKVNGVTYSWPSSQGASSTTLTNDGAGNLTWAAGGGAGGWTDDGTSVRLTTSTDNVGIGTATPASRLTISATTTATANSGTLSIGGAPFDGVGSGKFSGSSSGAVIAINEPTGYAGNFLDFQVNGVNKVAMDATGIITTAGSTNINLPSRRLHAANSSSSVDYANRTLSNGVTGTLLTWSGSTVTVNPSTTSDTALIAKGLASQTGDLLQLQNSSATALAKFNSAGLYFGPDGTSAAPAISFTGDTDTGAYRISADTLGLSTAGSERLRISSSGLVSVGTSTAIQSELRLGVQGSGVNTNVATFYNADGTAPEGIAIKLGVATPGTGDGFINFYNASAFIARVTGDGLGGILYNTTSDARLKENVVDTRYSIEDLMRIRVRDYNFISTPGKTTTGVIAQDLYDIYPAAVTVGGGDSKTDPWGVDYGRLTPLIVKSVQDLKSENDMLKAELCRRDATYRWCE